MRLLIILIWGFINPVSVTLSALPEDLEGSGYDLDGSGYGYGSELASSDEIEYIKFEPNTNGDSSSLTFDDTYWPTGVDASGSVILSNSKSLLNNPDILAGFIVGGVGGAIIGAALSAILIYRQIKKDGEKNQKKAAYEDYHKPIREQAFV